MANDTFDLIVIGAGSAARDGAAKASREHGARVTLVESTRWGGSCPNVACRPTKAYLVAGPVGLELAQIFARFGSRVTIVNHGPQIAARADGEAAAELHAALEDEDIEIVLDSRVESFARDGGMTLATLSGDRVVRVSH